MGEEVKMKPVKNTKVQEEKKLSYEELEAIARQLSARVQNLTLHLQSRDLSITFRRLDYLFSVINTPENTFPGYFRDTCIKEIIEIMSPEQEVKEEK